MASVFRDSNRRTRLQFIGADGKRHTIRLGITTRRQSQVFAAHVEALVTVSHGIGVGIDAPTALWLSRLSDQMHKRVAATGLVSPRTMTKMTLRLLLDSFFDNLEVNSQTMLNRQATRKLLLEFFGSETTIGSIQPLQAAKWRQWLKAQKYAEATMSKHVQLARQIFRQAIRWKLLSENPFADVKTGSQKNLARLRFISRADADAVIAACPDVQWKLLFALSRYGGLRCPSEHLSLRWSDVDWKKGRIRIPCKKTAHHAGREEREIPIFAELRPHLEEVRKEADAESGFVITRYRGTNTNLRTQLLRIIKKAGVKPWPRLFQNLRASRQTELTKSFPLHVVCSWIGNSEVIALNHYLSVTDDHFTKALSVLPELMLN